MPKITQAQKDAANQVLTHAHGLRAMLELAELVKSVGDIEAVVQEAKNAQVQAETDLARTRKALDAAKDDVAKAEKVIIEDRAEAAKHRREAKADADALVAGARKQAATITESAKAAYATADAEARKLIEAALAGQNEQIKAKSAELAQLEADVAAKTSLANDLDNRIENARKYLDKLASV